MSYSRPLSTKVESARCVWRYTVVKRALCGPVCVSKDIDSGCVY